MRLGASFSGEPVDLIYSARAARLSSDGKLYLPRMNKVKRFVELIDLVTFRTFRRLLSVAEKCGKALYFFFLYKKVEVCQYFVRRLV